MFTCSKLKIINTYKRIVEYTCQDGGEPILKRVQLRFAERCNAGDVQRSFNLQVRQKNYEGAQTYLNTRSSGVISQKVVSHANT